MNLKSLKLGLLLGLVAGVFSMQFDAAVVKGSAVKSASPKKSPVKKAADDDQESKKASKGKSAQGTWTRKVSKPV